MTEEQVFELALRRSFGIEGGVSDHPNDHGGLTNLGLSLRYLRSLGADRGGDIDLDGDVDAADVLKARPEDARGLYRRDFWHPSGAGALATRMPDIACETFDFALVRGPANAVRALQAALVYYGEDIDVDGGFGEQTLEAVVRFAGRAQWLAERALLAELRRRQGLQFARIVWRDRSQLAFLLGWEFRALDPED